ncbi:MAG: sulfatase-like hydrolase/transferase [Planctomycetota bacterium]|nr:sulfatase-like hydrolase/transferase [Planctomycetota bacterium]
MPITKPDQPNFLLICTDHWSDIFTRPGGHDVVMTPTLDQLARSGTRYSRAYSACPSCIPSRKSLMTGMRARTHGDRVYRDKVPLPDDVTTLPQCFRGAGYQSVAVGKLHTWPQRDRIGFDEVILEDQGRHQYHDVAEGDCDDYELYLMEQGYTGEEFASGMPTNDWISRAWQLPEKHHQINWAAREMCKTIRRRDPRKPGFWYLSFSAPHPPVVPPQAYLDLYRDVEIDRPVVGEWASNFDDLPWFMKNRTYPSALHGSPPEHEIRLARQAFYATLTQIDHQIRTVIGYLREAELLKNTYIIFTSDHGHMVGEHNMWCMTPFYEASAKIPLIIVPADGDERIGVGVEDDRFAEFADIMPTLLDLAGIPILEQVDQMSLIGEDKRDYIYGEHGESNQAQRMIRKDRLKLIYYPVGNQSQLFDLEADPRETNDLAGDPHHSDDLASLQQLLIENIWGSDLEWIKDGKLVGLPAIEFKPPSPKQLTGQRGIRFP